MFRRWILAAFALSTLNVNAAAQAPQIPPAVVGAANRIDKAQLKRDVDYLASDALRGRDTPSPGLDSAAAYVTRRLAALGRGVTPAGDGGTFRQHYTVRSQTLDTINTYLELGGRRLQYGRDFIVSAFSDTMHVSAPMAYAGHGMQLLKHNDDPYASVDVRGRAVIAHGPAVWPAGITMQSAGTFGIDWFGSWHAVDRKGGAAIILVHPVRLARRWDLFRANPVWLTRMELEPDVPSAYAAPKVPTIWIRRELLGEFLAGTALSAAEALAQADSGRLPPSFMIDPARRVTLHIALSKVETHRPHNVVARIEGSDPRLRHEAVVLMSHLDGAVSPPPPSGADSIYNAADDNASGSSALLSVAEAMLRAPRPRRSVIFVWDTGEEVGLWGSRFWAANPKVPLRDVVTHFNIDMIGRSKARGSNVPGEEELSGENEIHVVGPKVLSAELDTLLQRTNRALTNLRLSDRFDRADHEFFYPRTDAGPVMERGVLMVDFASGLHGDYHDVGDESHKLDLDKMLKVARLVFASAWQIADAPTRVRMDKGMPATVRQYPAIQP